MISTLARAKGVTQGELAEVIGVHRNRLADKIAGRVDFKESEIVAAARFFGVPPGRLFDDPVAVLTSGSSSAWTRTRRLALVA